LQQQLLLLFQILERERSVGRIPTSQSPRSKLIMLE
jgi:hypothetical protein